MKLKAFGLFLLLVQLTLISWSQEKTVLFTIDDEAVYAEDFKRVYQKNLDLVKDESQKDIDSYLDLYVNYALKLKEARTLGFDKRQKYLRELNGYRKQLAKNYMTDKKVTESLVEEAYDRISQDVWVSHILIRLPETETDTMTVINQLKSFKKRLENEEFDTVKASVHNGRSVIAEDLGYFSGFRTVYPFENEAYTTPIGSVSEPFRTSFGYHILKVNDRRPSRGYATVGHIFLSKNSSDSLNTPDKRIQEIHSLLNSGNSFEDLAKQFSEEKSTSAKGGKMNRFKSASLRSQKFEDQAFALDNEGDISQPFQTDFGWHILKLYKKEPIESFDQLKPELERRVKGDQRSSVINESLIKGLKQQYGVKDNVDLSYFIGILDDSYFSRQWSMPSSLPQDKFLLKIGDKTLNYFDFAAFLDKGQKRIREKQSFEGIVLSQFKAFVDGEILKYHEENLENVNEEFKAVLTEYRDGLLLFDLMEDQIWNAVKNDSAGIESYFMANREKYKWPERIDAIVATASDKDALKKVSAAMNSYDDLPSIKNAIDESVSSSVVFTSGLMSKGDSRLPEDYVFTTGVSKIFKHNGAYHIIKGLEIKPAGLKELDDARGRVISDYQMVKESQWLQELSKKYKVQINQDVFNAIKDELLD